MARTAQLGTPNVKSFTNCDATVSSDVPRCRVSAKGSRVFGFKCCVFFRGGDSGLRFFWAFSVVLNKKRPHCVVDNVIH